MVVNGDQNEHHTRSNTYIQCAVVLEVDGEVEVIYPLHTAAQVA